MIVTTPLAMGQHLFTRAGFRHLDVLQDAPDLGGPQRPEEKEPMSGVVRVSDEVHESAKKIAAVKGVSTADVFDAAMNEYIAVHKDDLAARFEHAAQAIREG